MRLFFLTGAFLSYWLASQSLAQGPALTVQRVSAERFELRWPSSATGFVLERTGSLAPPVAWQAAGSEPVLLGGTFVLSLPMPDRAGFFRLRQAGGGVSPLRVAVTSPLPGETGVAVTRESIFRLSAPLASDVTLGPGQIYADFGGRRVLARVELSTDRRTAALFFLENLPASAWVQVTFDSAGLRDASGLPLDLDGDGAPGGRYALSFVTAGLGALPNTGVTGRVFASEKNADGSNRPLAGVIVTVDGAEETLRAVTDANGFFHLQPAPAGRFFVHVDGRTAPGSQWPGGAYYPFVGKAWEATPGRSNNLAGGSGEIFLPLIPADTLRQVSAAEETVVTFPPAVLAGQPALEGVTVTVPPNALFSDNGARGGRVGIAPVPPDRLPEPLPPGLNLPIVITIQTDGPQNFDRPVPVRFPNLPDPVTGEKPGPGEKTVLWSFNHDTGHWEPQGTMTISSDGLFAESDPGVGVLQPGWHGSAPGSGGGGPCDTPDCAEDRDREEEEEDCEDGNANGICDEDDSRRCETDRLKTLFSGVDCFGNFIPQPETGPLASCLAAAATSASQAYRDCAIDPQGCGETKVVKGIEFAVDCAASALVVTERLKFIITGAKQLKCLLDTGLAYKTWELCLDATPAARPVRAPGLQATAADAPSIHALAVQGVPTRGNPFLQQYEIESAMEEYFAAFFGSEKWGQVYLADWPLFTGLMAAVGNAFGAASPGGAAVTAAERETLLSATRPEGIEPGDVTALIDRLSGNTLDYQRLAAASGRLASILTEVQSEGWSHIYEGYARGMSLLRQVSQARGMAGIARPGGPLLQEAPRGGTRPATGIARPSGSAAALQAGLSAPRRMPRRALYYSLTDTRSGFELRGRLNVQGTFNNIILRPLTPYVVTYFDPVTGRSGSAYFVSARSGQRTVIPSAVLALPPAIADTDGDGLSDLAERTLGTDPELADSDGDGLSDHAEVLGGTDPMDGFGLASGVVGSTPLPGVARDIAIWNGHALLAMELGGVTVVSLRDPLVPAHTGTLALSGQTVAVAADGLNAVAGNSTQGLVVLDLSDPGRPRARHLVSLGEVVAVAVEGRWAYAGTLNGTLNVADVETGFLRFQAVRPQSASRIDAIAPDGEWVYVLSNNQFLVFRQENGLLFFTASLPLAGGVAPLESGRKLLVAEGRGYAGYFEGYSMLNLADPLAPAITGRQSALQAAIHSLAAASARRLAPVTSFGGTGTLALSLYDVSDPSDVTRFLTSFDTPGQSRAAAIHRGLAYVADGPGRGVAVVNFVSPARDAAPPEVRIAGPWAAPAPRTEPGSFIRVPVIAEDNTLVREVTLLLDGEARGADGGYPFTFVTRAPAAAPGKTGFTLQAVASDFAGNARTSAPVTVAFAADATPPGLISVFPPEGSTVARELFAAVWVQLDEPAATIPPDVLRVFTAGADGVPNTADDVPVPFGALSVSGSLLRAAPPGTPANGTYYVRLAPGIADAAGNAQTVPVQWRFTIGGGRPSLSGVAPSGMLATHDTTVSNLFAALSSTLPEERAGDTVFTLSGAGADGRPGTADDVSLALSVAGYDVSLRRFHLNPALPLGLGWYRLRVTGAAVTASQVDFELRDPRNFWRVDRGGLWSDAANWTYPLAAGADLVIDRPEADIITTNRGGVPLFRSILSRERFYHATGNLGVAGGEAVFEALAEAGGDGFNDAAFTQGVFRFRGGLEIRSGTASNTRMAIHDATLVNESVTRWLLNTIDAGGESSVFFNAAGALFEIGDRAGGWALLSSTSPRARFVNAGLLRKPSGNNEVNMTGIDMQNDGQIVVEAGVLELSQYRGGGSVEARAPGTVYLGFRPRLAPGARVFGDGTVVLGTVAGTSSRELADVTSAWEVTGVTRVRGPGARFSLPLDLPGGTIETDLADLEINAPARLGRLRVRSNTRGAVLNAPVNTDELLLETGELAVRAPVTINQRMVWTSGRFSQGADLTLRGILEIGPGGPFGNGILRFTAGSDFVVTNAAAAVIGQTGIAMPVVNEGAFTKRGAGTLSFGGPVTNAGSIRIGEGVLALRQSTQGPGGQVILAGGELQLVSVGRVTLGGAFGGAGTVRFVSPIFGSLLALNGELRLPDAGGVLTLATHPIELGASARTVAKISPDGAGQIAGTVRLNGTLRVEFAPDYDPPAGSEWAIITSRAGAFAGVEASGLGAGKRIEAVYPENAGVVLRVVAE